MGNRSAGGSLTVTPSNDGRRRDVIVLPLAISDMPDVANIHFGGRSTWSGITSSPYGNGKRSKSFSRSMAIHGMRAPSVLESAVSTGPFPGRWPVRISHPSECCSSASPSGQSPQAPSCRTRLCSFLAAQLNLISDEYGLVEVVELD